MPSLVASDGMRMLLAPSGSLDIRGRSGTATRPGPDFVEVPAFWMDEHEVTVAQFRRFCVDSGRAWEPRAWQVSGADDMAVLVTWDDAAAYAAWYGKELPTEVQFEYALRTGDPLRRYPWGDGERPPDGYGNYSDESCRRESEGRGVPHDVAAGNCITGYEDGFPNRAPVRSFPPNEWGFHDLSGNEFEWCADWFKGGGPGSPLSGDPEPERESVEKFEYIDMNEVPGHLGRVVRGGNWASGLDALRCTYRRWDPPRGVPYNGFRCVMAARPRGG